MTTPPAPSRRRRMRKVLEWLIGIAILLVVLNLLGVDVRGWFQQLWDEIRDMPKGYLLAACTAQFGQTFFAGLSYYGILKYAYPAEVTLWQIGRAHV